LEPAIDQRLFFLGGGWLGELGEGFGREIGEGKRSGEGCGVVEDFVPVVEFVGEGELLLHVGEAREHDPAEESEGGGFAKGDAVLGGGDKEFAEDVVDVGGGEEIAVEGGGDFAAQALGLEELPFLAGMEGTERRMGRAAQHAAGTAVGKVKLAARGNASAGIRIHHGSLLEVDLC